MISVLMFKLTISLLDCQCCISVYYTGKEKKEFICVSGAIGHVDLLSGNSQTAPPQ